MQFTLYPFVLFFLLAGWPCTRVPAQEIYRYQGFEVSPEESLPFVPSTDAYGVGSVPTWNSVEQLRGIDGPTEGTRFWAARDVENAITGSPVSELVFDAGSICTLTSARFVFDYNVIGYDAGDDFGYALYLDGFLHETEVLVDGKNGGGTSTPGWVSHSVPIPGTAQTAKLVLYFDQNGDDVAGVDNVRLMATGDDGNCTPVCGIRLGEETVNCGDFTTAADLLTLRIRYSGAEEGARVSVSGATVGGDDPSTRKDGVIDITDLREGTPYLLEVSGGDCALERTLSYPADQCAPSSLVINEILAAPAEDINGDGLVTPADEFVELFNTDDAPQDVAGFTLHDASNSGARFTFPEGATLGARERFVIFASAATVPDGCAYGVASGFLGLNDNSPETVSLRDRSGRIVAQASFDAAPRGESLVLSPDGNLAGGYHAHSTVVPNTTSSACIQQNLPVDLLSFTATPLTDAVRLDWVTSREVDNDRFIVERSKEGRDFTPIGAVPAGTGTYAFVDAAPFPGQNLYRLRQVDLDGGEAVYGPVMARLDSGLIRLYPNPATRKLHLTGDIAQDERVNVYHSDGRLLSTSLGATVDVSRLPAGSYYLRLRRGSGARSFRFIKE